jgi:hypothetical protein
MDKNADPAPMQWFLALSLGTFVLVITASLIVWLLIAFLACAVAPDDRPWSFFWCTFLLLGPVGVVVALLAQPRNYST